MQYIDYIRKQQSLEDYCIDTNLKYKANDFV